LIIGSHLKLTEKERGEKGGWGGSLRDAGGKPNISLGYGRHSPLGGNTGKKPYLF